jgi:hypothetical protein
VVKALSYKVSGSRLDEVKFSIYLILPATLGSRVYSASNRNEYRKHQWLRRYATSRKVVGSRPDVVKFKFYVILPGALGPGVYSASNRN